MRTGRPATLFAPDVFWRRSPCIGSRASGSILNPQVSSAESTGAYGSHACVPRVLLLLRAGITHYLSVVSCIPKHKVMGCTEFTGVIFAQTSITGSFRCLCPRVFIPIRSRAINWFRIAAISTSINFFLVCLKLCKSHACPDECEQYQNH